MKIVLNCLRYSLISFEFLICLIGVFTYIRWPAQLIWVSQRIGDQAELLKCFGLLPAALVVYDSNCVKTILAPGADTKNLLQKWELYLEFKIGCVIGLLYSVLFAISGVLCFLFDWKHPAAFQSSLLLTSVAGAAIVAASFYLHGIKIEEIFRQHMGSAL